MGNLWDPGFVVYEWNVDTTAYEKERNVNHE